MVVQHNMQAANANRMLNITHSLSQLRNFLLDTESTVQQMMQQDFQFQRK